MLFLVPDLVNSMVYMEIHDLYIPLWQDHIKMIWMRILVNEKPGPGPMQDNSRK